MASSSPVSVLYIHFAGGAGGAPRSLGEAFRHMPEGAVRAEIICPRGRANDYFASLGMTVIPVRGISGFDHSDHGHYRGLRWLVLLREILHLPFTLAILWKLRARRDAFDLIHVNEVFPLPTTVLARILLRKPVVMHARSVQRMREPSLRARLIRGAMRRYVDRVVAIDQTVERSLSDDVPTTVIYNPVNKPAPEADGEAFDVPLRPESFKVSIIGGLIEEKGVREFLEAVRICRAKSLDVEAMVVGEAPRAFSPLKKLILGALGLKRDLGQYSRDFLAAHGLGGAVHLLGFRSDIDRIYRRTDVLCFPCYVEAIGRPVWEAALHGKPSIFTLRDAPPDSIRHGTSGLAVAPRDAEALAEAIETLYRDRDLARRLGCAAREWAEHMLDIHASSRRLLGVYHNVLGRWELGSDGQGEGQRDKNPDQRGAGCGAA